MLPDLERGSTLDLTDKENVMNILVIGGTGTVGSQVARELQSRQVEVSVLTRSPEKAAALPRGQKGVVGDLLDPATIRSVFRGVDAVFLLNPVSATETHEGLMALNGARLNGVKRIVYLSVHDADKAPLLPHFGSKLAVETGLEALGIPFTILRPNNFYQNDSWYRDVLLQYGKYPQPIGSVGVSRVDVRDIVEAAVIALTKGGLDGRTVNLVGPTAWTGEATAALWSKVLGKEIEYLGDVEAFEKGSLSFLPPWMAFDFRLMYEHFQRAGLKATPEDIEKQTKLLGHPPRRYEDFVRETAAMWTSSGVPA